MKKYNLYDSLELLDYIKREHDIEKIKEFEFNEQDGFTATFDKRLMISNEYIIIKGIIKNQMMFYASKVANIINQRNDIIIDRNKKIKIVYGNIDDLYEVSTINVKDYDNVCQLLKSYIEDGIDKFSKDKLDLTNREIAMMTVDGARAKKVVKENKKVIQKVNKNKD